MGFLKTFHLSSKKPHGWEEASWLRTERSLLDERWNVFTKAISSRLRTYTDVTDSPFSGLTCCEPSLLTSLSLFWRKQSSDLFDLSFLEFNHLKKHFCCPWESPILLATKADPSPEVTSSYSSDLCWCLWSNCISKVQNDSYQGIICVSSNADGWSKHIRSVRSAICEPGSSHSLIYGPTW